MLAKVVDRRVWKGVGRNLVGVRPRTVFSVLVHLRHVFEKFGRDLRLG